MTSNPVAAAVIGAFKAEYGAAPTWLTRAPGRVNLIGEHTDYNDGFVLPMAIERASWIALRARSDGSVSLRSLDFDEQRQFELDDNAAASESWLKYVHAVAQSLQSEGVRLRGWEGVTAGDVPIGAGLSSSAAFELAAARAFACVASLPWDARRMALAAQRAENVYVGVNCGIMDQLISAAGEEGHALLIDCRSLEGRAVPMPADVDVVILDTSTRRGLVESAYNERRAHCETAARLLGVRALRDVTEDEFAARAHELDAVIRKRARHVITENARTLRAAAALTAGNIAELGELMNQSHESLRDDFEVSRHELNVIVDLAGAQPGCYGARMTGAGFGGCAVAIVDAQVTQSFVQNVSAAYSAATQLTPAVYVSRAAGGASVELKPAGRK